MPNIQLAIFIAAKLVAKLFLKTKKLSGVELISISASFKIAAGICFSSSSKFSAI